MVDPMASTIYQRIGVKTVINADATQTALGGSIMRPAVVEAMAEASRHFVDMRALQRAVGARIAGLTRNEDALVTSGATSGLFLTVAGLLKLKDPALFACLPEDVPRLHRVIVFRYQYSPFITAIREAGVRLVELGPARKLYGGEASDLSRELDQGALAVVWIPRGEDSMPGGPATYERIAKVCRERDVPLIVDAAAQLPPSENLWRFTEQGATAAIFSGGKDLRGPSSTGLVVGRKYLMEACRGIVSPNLGIGRLCKVDKEEMVGLMVAVEEYLSQDHAARSEWCEQQVAKLQAGLRGIAGVTVTRDFPNEAGQPVAWALVSFDPVKVGRSREELLRAMAEADPPVAFHSASGDAFSCNPMTLQEGEMDTIVGALRTAFASGDRGQR